MKRITTILSLIAMMLVSSVTYADDINIFLRNQWDNEMEDHETEDTTRDTQVLFLADRLVSTQADACTPEVVDLKNMAACVGDDCYTITVTVNGSENGTVYQADETTDITAGGTWSAKKGNPGLFKVVPNDNYMATYTSTCGGSGYPNYFMTDYAVKTDCALEISFVEGDPIPRCDARPTNSTECTTLKGVWKNGACVFDNATDTVPTNKDDCDAINGFWADGSARGNNAIQFNSYYPTYSWDGSVGINMVLNGLCLLPDSSASEGDPNNGELLYFCDPPVFKSCVTEATDAGMDYRSVIAKVMRERPDAKYGLYAVNGSGATQVFPVKSRELNSGDESIEDIIADELANNFPSVGSDELTTMSALEDVYDYLEDSTTSPLLNQCAHLQLVILASGGYSGDDTKFSESENTFDLKKDAIAFTSGSATSYSDLLKDIAKYLNNDDENHHILNGCTARVTTNVIGVNPVENSALFTESNSEVPGEQMAILGGGIYEYLTLTADTDEAKDEFGTDLLNTILKIVDHSREDETALITPVAPVSISRAYHVDSIYAPAFKAQKGVNWPGNITAGTKSAIPSASFEDNDTDFSFPAARKIYTLNESGDVTELIKDGDGEDDFNQADVNWLKHLSTSDSGDPSLFSAAQKRELLGDILHFRPLPIHIGDQEETPDGVVDVNELFIVVGTNRGLLHVFNKAGLEQWAFLPPQLKPMIKALRQDNTAPEHSMVNHFYGVDGAPSVFIYDAGKDGSINPDDNTPATNASDKIFLYFGLRRGGAGYFALDITRPANPPVALWNAGSSVLQYGAARSSTVVANEASGTQQTAENIDTPVDEEEVTSGTTVEACNEVMLSQGTAVTSDSIGDQCPNTLDLNGDACSGTATEVCLQGTCDKVGGVGMQSAGGGCGFNGVCHSVLETLSGIYVGTQEDQGDLRIFSARKLCTPKINSGDVSIDIKPEAALHYSVLGGGHQACHSSVYSNTVTGVKTKDSCQGHLCVGTYIAAAVDSADIILGFNITPLAEKIANNEIKITKAVLSLGHTGYPTEDKYNNYGTGINVYAARNGAYGDHPWAEADGSSLKTDCNIMNDTVNTAEVSLNSGKPVAVIKEPLSGTTGLGDRSSGGEITNETVLADIFSEKGWFISQRSGNKVKRNTDGSYSFDGTWTDNDVYIQFGLKEISSETSVLFGRVVESAGVANFMTSNSEYYEDVMPNLEVTWCWLSDPNCASGEPTGPTLKVAISGTGSSVAVVKDNTTVATCAAGDSPCTYTNHAENDEITLVATPGDGEVFSNWSGCTASQFDSKVCSITLGSSTNDVFATFEGTPYDLQVTLAGVDGLPASDIPSVMAFIDGSGTGRDAVSGLTGSDAISAGAEVKLEAEVPDGKLIKSWSGQPDGATGCTAGVTTCTFNMPAATTNVTVTYETPASYTLTVNAGSHGSVQVNGDACSASPPCVYTSAEEKTYTITVGSIDEGYEASLSGCTGDVSGCSVTIGSSKTTATVNVTYDLLQYTVTASSSGGGADESVQITTGQPMDHGSSAQISITVGDDYKIKSVSGCNGDGSDLVGKTSGTFTYTTGGVVEACAVTVEFEEVSTSSCTTIASATCTTHKDANRLTCSEKSSDWAGNTFYGCNANDGEACTYQTNYWGTVSNDVSVQLFEDESGVFYSTESACLSGSGGSGDSGGSTCDSVSATCSEHASAGRISSDGYTGTEVGSGGSVYICSISSASELTLYDNSGTWKTACE